MSSFTKILSHPARNTIIRMLSQGQGIRTVARYLREKYPDDKKLHVSEPTLQKFRKEKLNIEGQALDAIKQAAKEKKAIKEEKKEDTKLRRLPAYKEKIQEAVDLQVDIRKELSELLVLVKSRTEDLFDKAARGEITINEEANLQRYFQAWTTAIERWAKYIDKVADKTVETNVNITVIEDQMCVLREAIVETIQEMAPELKIKFLDKLSNKMTDLSYRHKGDMSFTDIHTDAKILTASIAGSDEHGD